MRRKQRGRTWGKGKEKKRKEERGRKRETEGRDRLNIMQRKLRSCKYTYSKDYQK